jgi:hypothetical protein
MTHIGEPDYAGEAQQQRHTCCCVSLMPGVIFWHPSKKMVDERLNGKGGIGKTGGIE